MIPGIFPLDTESRLGDIWYDFAVGASSLWGMG
jgi:hypothetical protein